MLEGKILERILDGRRAAARIACAANLIPAPGQYLLAHLPASDDPLAVAVFSAGVAADGFYAASPLPSAWTAGAVLSLRGPLGRGFAIPANARRVALAAWDVSPAYLLGLIPLAEKQGADLVLLCDDPPEDIPSDVEIRPLAALDEIAQWADTLALAASRAGWRERVHERARLKITREVQVLIVTPMPCGGLAQCGVCSVEVGKEMGLACEDGPVFSL
jgi:dihydroorotate dehydrogenase electron transfer subunit